MFSFEFFQRSRCERSGIKLGQLVIEPVQAFGMIVPVGERTDFGADALPATMRLAADTTRRAIDVTSPALGALLLALRPGLDDATGAG